MPTTTDHWTDVHQETPSPCGIANAPEHTATAPLLPLQLRRRSGGVTNP
jgi:hypothetical protein